jgi:Asp-tRNA(Asn)/Glu-tRNA(Gln) amidotransferase A subunit family amidase
VTEHRLRVPGVDVDGLPVGLSIIGAPRQRPELVAIARALADKMAPVLAASARRGGLLAVTSM